MLCLNHLSLYPGLSKLLSTQWCKAIQGTILVINLMLKVNYLFSPLRDSKIIYHWYCKKPNLLLLGWVARCQLACGKWLFWVFLFQLFFLGVLLQIWVFPILFTLILSINILIYINNNNKQLCLPEPMSCHNFTLSILFCIPVPVGVSKCLYGPYCWYGLNHDICNNLGCHRKSMINCNY